MGRPATPGVTQSMRTRRREAKVIGEGGRKLYMLLGADAARALAALCEREQRAATPVIEQLLIEAVK